MLLCQSEVSEEWGVGSKKVSKQAMSKFIARVVGIEQKIYM